MIRVVIADDHAMVRAGILVMLAKHADIEVVGEAESGPEAVELVQRLHPDLLLCDLRMPGGDGIDAIRRISELKLGTAVLVLTTYDSDQDILRAIEAGANGYVLKDIDGRALAEAIRSTVHGETVLDSSAARVMAQQVRAPSHQQLSAQELQVLRGVANGLTNVEIGKRLFISESTVKTYLQRIFQKLGVSDRTSAVVTGLSLGLLGDGSDG